MSPAIIIIIAVVILVLGIAVFPFINKKQLQKMPFEQQVRILMKQAKGLIFFKNISNGSSGTLIYIKNKRKIYTYPWILRDGRMLCTRKDLFKNWDYPEEKPEFTEEEKTQAIAELEKYNDKSLVKIYLDLD